jgi:chaperone required for assembly of F1-ATPase
MSGWAAKRFWRKAEVVPAQGGFAVQLDGRGVKTPAKTPLILPSETLAQLIAAEWQAQSGLVQPETMPLTRRANSALDKVAPNRAAVIDEMARYGASDLLCYRAEAPVELAARQAAAWQHWLDWAAQSLNAPLRVTAGIVPIDQPPASLAALQGHIAQFDNFALAGLHDLVSITGSLVLGLAMAKGQLTADQGFALSRIDEAWQAEHWGTDADAAALESAKAAALASALIFLHASG